jgi:hypothetical protein
VKFAGVMPVAAVPGVTNRTRNSPPCRMSPFVRPVQTVWAPAVTAEQANVALLALFSTPMVVETKMNGLLFATVPAGAVAVTLKVNEETLTAWPAGPPAKEDETVHTWPTRFAHAVLGVPTRTGVAAVAIAVSSAFAVDVAFGVSVIVGVAVFVRVAVAVAVGTSAVCVAATAVCVPGIATAVCVSDTAV